MNYNKFLKPLFLTTVIFSSYVYANTKVSFSGFGTVGYSISDAPYSYLKYIDNDGTFLQDTLLGGQVDIQFTRKWSATVQGKVLPNKSQESGFEGDISWAFLSYRPSNDWLFRLGKLQVPGYLNSANSDVGVTYDYIRIPAEYDSTSPVYDFTGISINKTFALDEGDLVFDLYGGKTKGDWRYYVGNDIPGITSTGGGYTKVSVDIIGTSISYKSNNNTYIASFHKTNIQNSGGLKWQKEPVYVEIIPDLDIGYYSDVSDDPLLGVDNFDFYITNLAADISLGNDVKLSAELAIRNTADLFTGINSTLGYISVRKKINNWTPYLFYSQAKTYSKDLAKHKKIDENTIPDYIPSADVVNASQHVIADIFQAYDQFSIGVGTSYSFSMTSLVKAEVLFVHVGESSSLFDISSKYETSNYDATVLSLSYNFTF